MGPTRSLTLLVDGMTCGACATHVEWTLQEVSGVVASKADLASGSATVAYIPDGTDLEQLERSLVAAGYTVRGSILQAELPETAAPTVGPRRSRAARRPLALTHVLRELCARVATFFAESTK